MTELEADVPHRPESISDATPARPLPFLVRLVGLRGASATRDLDHLRINGQRHPPTDWGHGRLPRRAAKRTIDLVAAFIGLLLAAPLMAVIALILWIEGGSSLFRQPRVGRGGEEFTMLKFRTLKTAAQEHADLLIGGLISGHVGIDVAVNGLKFADASQATRFGSWLRKTSLDELPQLLHVLSGRMSLVGPRPLRRFEVDSLEPWQLGRLEMRPGLTGLWQVSGRSDVDWPTRMWLDYLYVQNWSVRLDLAILAGTPVSVLALSGAR